MHALKSLLLASCCLLAPLSPAEEVTKLAAPMDIPLMQNETASAGIDQQYTGPWEFFVGGGLAVLDCNQDRMPDVFIAGGEQPAKLYRNASKTGEALVFKPQPLTLEDNDLKQVTGAYPLDIDNDGFQDLVVLKVGRNLLLKGGADCSFTKANKLWNYEGGNAWTTAFAATFEKGQTYPTLAFGNYVDRSAPGSPWGTCHENDLFRPSSKAQADYHERTALAPGFCALSMLFTDWNKSGEPALRITNDRQYYREGEEQLWRIPADNPPKLYSRNDGWQRVLIWGMGIAEGDLEGDGFPEYALTSMGDTRLQVLDDEAEEDRPIYKDSAYERQATAHRPYIGEDLKPSTGWHAEFDDVNNDTKLDLFIAKGNVEAMPDFAAFDPDNLLLGQWNKKFYEAGHESGIDLARRGRGATLHDFNADGLLDLMVVNRKDPVSVFRNLGAKTAQGTQLMGNWLEIELAQTGANRHAVGASIAIKTGVPSQIRRIQVGGGHASGESGFVHVGLGVAERATIRIQWPDGQWSAEYRVFANQFVLIKKDDPQVRYWYPQ
ncbi:CRTAC1 family protein [uncultured Thiothrix sp.]|uniref:CRTAC1 family protein n=1 Tax=uncultured Thiothrix sp. TaxID=223185 RepID=UPI002605965B|nr:CRTAC1 family protein [uncultured Thiothrix sp.]HMT93251.1 CRTAC1 family protein [Thiolinea sp.]